jgi:hypothetical protein
MQQRSLQGARVSVSFIFYLLSFYPRGAERMVESCATKSGADQLVECFFGAYGSGNDTLVNVPHVRAGAKKGFELRWHCGQFGFPWMR